MLIKKLHLTKKGVGVKMNNLLLYCLSTKGQMSISSLKALIHDVGIFNKNENTHFGNIVFETLRNLESLGYCKVDYLNRRVFVCPPALRLIPNYGEIKVVYTGARSPRIIKNLKEFQKKNKNEIRIEHIRNTNSYNLIPDSIFLYSYSKDILKKLANSLKIDTFLDIETNFLLAKFSNILESYSSTVWQKLKSTEEINWKKKYFSERKLCFTHSKERRNFQLAWYEHPVNPGIVIHLFWVNDKSAEVNREWGRYLLLSKLEKNVLSYNRSKLEFYVPTTIRLPKLLEESLVMSSGLCPKKDFIETDYDYDFKHQIYRKISPQIADIISKKISQIPKKIKNLRINRP